MSVLVDTVRPVPNERYDTGTCGDAEARRLELIKDRSQTILATLCTGYNILSFLSTKSEPITTIPVHLFLVEERDTPNLCPIAVGAIVFSLHSNK